MEAWERIALALDVGTGEEAINLAQNLTMRVGVLKVGLQLFVAEGPDLVRKLQDMGFKVFLDLKFHDIPTTIGKAARQASKLGVWAFNVHASAGDEGLKAAVDNRGDSLVLGVTVLTSFDVRMCQQVYMTEDLQGQVQHFADMTLSTGCQGLICSPQELAALRAVPEFSNLLTMVPGTRPIWAEANDQKRVLTPFEAMKAGADYLVHGRAIIKPPPGVIGQVSAAISIADEMQLGLEAGGRA